MKEESRFLDDSLTPSEDGTLLRSTTPTTIKPPSLGTLRSNSSTSDLPPPAHLLQPILPEVAVEGSTPVIVRKLMNLSNGGSPPEDAEAGKRDVAKEEMPVAVAARERQAAMEVKVVGTTDVISDMQKLRLRLEEECRQEIAAMDRQFQTRIHHIPESNSRPGSAPSQRKELQGPRPSNASHSRGSSDASDMSGPVEVNHRREYSLPVSLERKDDLPYPPIPVQQRTSHTPPQQTRQMSSPHHSPAHVLSTTERTVAANNNNNKGFSTPPPIRSPPAYPQPVFQSFRQVNHTPRAVPNVQFSRTSSANAPSGQPHHQEDLSQSYNLSDVPVQVGGTHYSTLVVKGRKHHQIPTSVSVSAGSEQQYASESPFYDRLGPHLVDQPEQKAISQGNSQPGLQQQQQQPQLKSASHQSVHLPARSSTYQAPHRSHSKLEPRNSVPVMQVPPPPATLNGGHSEVIQPYMSSVEVKTEMKKYVPFADKKRKSGDGTSIPEQTWC